MSPAPRPGRPPAQSPVPMPERGMGSRAGLGRLPACSRPPTAAGLHRDHQRRPLAALLPGVRAARPGRRPAAGQQREAGCQPAITIPRIQAVAAPDSAELVGRLEQAQVPYSPVNNPFDLLDDPQLNSGGKLMEVETEAGGTIKTAGGRSLEQFRTVGPAPATRARPAQPRGAAGAGLQRGRGVEALTASGAVRQDGPCWWAAERNKPAQD